MSKAVKLPGNFGFRISDFGKDRTSFFSEIRNPNSEIFHTRWILVFMVTALLLAAPPPARCETNPILQNGEELVYKVKFGFVRLGTAIVKTERDATSGDVNQYKIIITLDSSPSVPFITMHEYNVSVVDAIKLMSKSFYGLHDNSGTKTEVQFHYDDAARRCFFFRKDVATGVKKDELVLEDCPPYLEGPSMFFYGRSHAKCGQILTVPTFVDGVLSNTRFDFTCGRQYINIDAVDNHVRTRKFNAQIQADKASSAGISGGFSIWVSDDESAVPIRAEMKIIVGSVTLELEKWTRANWTPPS